MRTSPRTSWCRTLQPYKIVFLTGTGGLLDGDGRVIDSINLSTEYEHLMAQPWLNGGMRVKIEQIQDLLDALPPASSVSITRPAELAKELFTHKGRARWCAAASGCCGDHAGSELDTARLRGLVESAFGRKPAARLFRPQAAAPRLRQRELPRRGDPDRWRAACRTSTSSPCSTTRRAKAWAARSGR